MPSPLQPDDPTRLGPFRLTARLHESPAGIAYLGVDISGRQVSVGLLTTAAAADAAARDRFRTAIASRAEVVAAQPDGPAPWVATPHEEGRPGAERFFDAVLLRRGWGSVLRRRGPQFQPYWAGGASGPALEGTSVVAPPPPETRTLAASVLSLAALLVVLAALAVLLYKCQPKLPDPPPPAPPPIQTVPATPIPPPSSVPATPVPRPTPGTPCPSASATPSPFRASTKHKPRALDPSPSCSPPVTPPPGGPGL